MGRLRREQKQLFYYSRLAASYRQSRRIQG
jgi:hypothetical protein